MLGDGYPRLPGRAPPSLLLGRPRGALEKTSAGVSAGTSGEADASDMFTTYYSFDNTMPGAMHGNAVHRMYATVTR